MKSCVVVCFLLVLHFLTWSQEALDRSKNQLLWEISGNGLAHPSFLFGTFHSNDPEIFQFTDSVYWAVLQSEAIVLETDLTEMMGELNVIKKRYNYNAVPQNIRWLLPTRSKNTITETQYGNDAGRPQFIDLYFKEIGDACGKQFFPLESIEDQLEVGTNLIPVKNKKRYRNATAEELKNAYLIGNIEVLHDLTARSTMNFENLYDQLLANRNLVMADGLDTLMRQYRLFCGVGAAHLGGKKGIIPLLRKKGYILRPVQASFSDNKLDFQKELEKCHSFVYTDSTFGFKIPFGGKPNVTNETDGIRSIDYQELGQGNSYSLIVSHIETIVSPKKMARAYFKDNSSELSFFDSLYLEDGTICFQGKYSAYDGDYWVRSFCKNDILYILSASGGFRFMNSKRPMQFFDQFEFLPKVDSFDFSSRIVSPIGTLAATLPKDVHIYTQKNEDEFFWSAKWFNPSSAENCYIYESFLTNNAMYFKKADFGEFLLNEFDTKDLIFSETKDKGDYIEKSFQGEKNGRKVHGIVRLMGNVLQFAQYVGESENRKNIFLDGFETLVNFNPLPEKPMEKGIYKVVLPTTDFKWQEDKYPVGYRKLKHYTLHDYEKAVSFELFAKEAKEWAYVESSVKDLLVQQINWQPTTTPQNVDTVFFLNDSIPKMQFKITYLETKNIYQGTVMLTGKKLVTLAMIYPEAADEAYGDYAFTSQFQIGDMLPNDLQNVDLNALQMALNDKQERANVVAFFQLPFTSSTTAKTLLYTLDSLDNPRGNQLSYPSPRSVLVTHIAPSDVDDSFFDYWQKYALMAENRFSENALYIFAQHPSNHLYFEAAFRRVINFSLTFDDELKFLELLPDFPDRIAPFWSYLVKKTTSKPVNPKFFDFLETNVKQPIVSNYLVSEAFLKYCLTDKQPTWVAFRYFQLNYLVGASNRTLLQAVTSWNIGESQERLGIQLAWRQLLNDKLSRKEKQIINQNLFVATGYAKVMAVNNAVGANLISYHRTLGLLAFDYYQDNRLDANKVLTFVEEVSLSFSNEILTYAVFEGKENGVTFYFARLIPLNRDLPDYNGFGKDVLFLKLSPTPSHEEMIYEITSLLAL